MYKEIIRDPEAQLFTARGMKHLCMAYTLYEMKTQALLGLSLIGWTHLSRGVQSPCMPFAVSGCFLESSLCLRCQTVSDLIVSGHKKVTFLWTAVCHEGHHGCWHYFQVID